jgi:ABC-type nitrate/sulfonate/bicarbonate transport system substrate-binding protein
MSYEKKPDKTIKFIELHKKAQEFTLNHYWKSESKMKDFAQIITPSK